MHVNSSSSGIIGSEYLDCASTIDTIDTFLISFFWMWNIQNLYLEITGWQTVIHELSSCFC